jgi:FKBP-type peptidyl-prolyl cis-trans isomerase FkpA
MAMKWSLLLALAAVACGDAERPPAEGAPHAAVDTVAAVEFAPELGVDPAAMEGVGNGVLVQEVAPGRGRVAETGMSVAVEYRGYLPDGTLFEQRPSPEGFGPSEFVLGESAPVPGLGSGIAGMRVGGTRRIVVPPEHGYGLVGRPAGVPAGATLVFEVRLLRVEAAPAPPPDDG